MKDKDYKHHGVPMPKDKYSGKELFDETGIDEREEMTEADPQIREAMKKEGTLWELMHMTNKPSHLYSGSGTEMEIAELEDSIRYLIQNGRFTYNALEDYLISARYNLKDIRTAFEKVTGVSPNKYQSKLLMWEDVPKEVPPVTLGWGKSKNKKYDYLFIMPYCAGYQIFGQKDDIVRDELETVLTYEDAVEYLKKNSSKPSLREEAVAETLKENKDITQPLFSPIKRKTSYNNLSDYFYKLDGMLSEREVRAMLDGAVQEGEITDDEKTELLEESGFLAIAADYPETETKDVNPEQQQYMDDAKDVREKVRELEDQDIAEVFEEQTPQDFFDNETEDESISVSKNIEDVMKYIGNKAEALTNFKLNVLSFKYKIFEDVKSDFDKNVDVSNEPEIKDFLAASAIIPVLIEVENISDERTDQDSLKGMTIFAVVDGEVITDDLVKFENNKMYSMTNEGLYAAFAEYQQ